MRFIRFWDSRDFMDIRTILGEDIVEDIVWIRISQSIPAAATRRYPESEDAFLRRYIQ